MSFIEPMFAWNVPLVSLIFLKRSLVFPILLFSSISLHWSLKKAFLFLLAILWNSPFRCLYLKDGRVMVERSDRKWSTGEGNGKPLQYSWLENPMNTLKRQKDRTLKDELPRLVGTQYASNLEHSAVGAGLEKVNFHSNPKERQCQRMLKLPHNCTHLTR